MNDPLTLLERMLDLEHQATVERSHYYVGSILTEAACEITRLRALNERLAKQVEWLKEAK